MSEELQLLQVHGSYKRTHTSIVYLQTNTHIHTQTNKNNDNLKTIPIRTITTINNYLDNFKDNYTDNYH